MQAEVSARQSNYKRKKKVTMPWHLKTILLTVHISQVISRENIAKCYCSCECSRQTDDVIVDYQFYSTLLFLPSNPL